MTDNRSQAQQQTHGGGGTPVIVDVFAQQAPTGGVDFRHEWRFENGPSQGHGTIDIPKAQGGDPATAIHFHLHDNSGQALRFDQDDAIWVKRSQCPDKSCDDPEIPRGEIQAQPKLLKVTNRNSEQCELHYNLRFKAGDGGLAEYDPVIKNGGR